MILTPNSSNPGDDVCLVFSECVGLIWNTSMTGYDRELRQWCMAHGVIYTSFWSLTANPKHVHSEVVQQMATTYKKTPAQIWFRFLLHRGIVPLTGTCDVQVFQRSVFVIVWVGRWVLFGK